MRKQMIEWLEKRRGVPFTPHSASKSLGLDRSSIQAELSLMYKDGLLQTYVNSLGVTEYVYSGAAVDHPNTVNTEVEPMKSQPAKTRTAPYTANKIAGAYESKGNVVIKLWRRTNAKSITITRQDFDGIAAFFAGGRS